MTEAIPEEDDVIFTSPTETQPSPNPETAVGEDPDMADDGDLDDVVTAFEPQAAPTEDTEGGVKYPEDKIDFRGEDPRTLVNLIEAAERELSARELDRQVRTVGSWANLMFRAITDISDEEHRIQEAISQMTDEEREGLSDRLVRDKKTLLRTVSIQDRVGKGETVTLQGDAALLAFECSKKGGGYRIPLYNSGITIDVIVPTGNDIQTLLFNCTAIDNQLGSSDGAHYFAYNDLMLKTQIINFLQPLIINSSYVDWRKKNKLWSIIKMPDLEPLVATLAALCYKDGFDGFVTKCTRPVSAEHPTLCAHTETHKVNIFEMILTRFPAMNTESINFMVAARMGNATNTVSQIAKYQEVLGLEGERLSFDVPNLGTLTFTMRIPTIAEHLEAGSLFIADIINEIEGDNTEGRYEQFGFRFIRTFLPWVGSVELKGDDDNVAITTDAKVIIRQLEKLDDSDPDGKVRERLRQYINKVQLTYVGYPATPCPVCSHTADTPSGMLTFDPFTVFFTLAFLSSTLTA